MTKIIIPTKIVQRAYVECPSCEGDVSTYGHVDKGPDSWKTECPHCGDTYDFTFDGQVVTAQKLQRSGEYGLSLLKYCSNGVDNQLFIVIEDRFYYDRENVGTLDMDKSYLYGVHTCPTNFLPVALICHNGDSDPHGVFEYVRGVTYADILAHFGVTKETLLDSNNSFLEAYFPELGRDVEPESINVTGGV